MRSDFVIIGGGPAGYTAGVYGARAMLDPLLIEGPQPGGQLTITTDVENWPGQVSVQGPDLVAGMAEHARAAGTRFYEGTVIRVDRRDDRFDVVLEDGTTIDARAVLVATGAVAKWTGIPGEETYLGYGVSACATCDGFFFKDMEVVVIGGGNSAMEEALFLTNFASKVHLVHRRDSFRGERILQKRVKAHDKIAIHWNTEPLEIEGDGERMEVSGVQVRDVASGETRTIACSGVFVAIGHAPASGIVAHLLDLNADGTIPVTPGGVSTSVPGLFAAGDVADSRYRQAITSAGMGCMAALDAEHFLSIQKET